VARKGKHTCWLLEGSSYHMSGSGMGMLGIPASYLFLYPIIRTHVHIFYLTHSCICLELFSRVQLMRVHDLAKYV
jgi:hypothetical protein